jgi:hypothetical protein
MNETSIGVGLQLRNASTNFAKQAFDNSGSHDQKFFNLKLHLERHTRQSPCGTSRPTTAEPTQFMRKNLGLLASHIRGPLIRPAALSAHGILPYPIKQVRRILIKTGLSLGGFLEPSHRNWFREFR